MSCVLSIVGENLDVDAFIDKIGIKEYKKWYKGEPRNKVSKRINNYSGVSIITTETDFADIKTQTEQTIIFLNLHRDKLKHITTTPGIDFATIDFGIDSTLDKDHLIQGFYFPKPLIKICAELDIEIELSVYKPDMQVILERRRLGKGKQK